MIPENSLIEITVTDMRDATLYFDMQDNSEVLVGDIIKASPILIALKFFIRVGTTTSIRCAKITLELPSHGPIISHAQFTEHSRLCHR